jgi:LuxR family maltose regulon positive regulatory protein
MRGTDLHGAIEHLERAVELAGQDAPSYWHAHALLQLSSARHRLGDGLGAKEALVRAGEELDQLPDAGALGALYDGTDAALHQRGRRDGFLGEPLSDAELRILGLLLEGRSISEIAHELWLSANTVKSHRRSIYRKLGVHSREALHAVVLELGVDTTARSDVHPG